MKLDPHEIDITIEVGWQGVKYREHLSKVQRKTSTFSMADLLADTFALALDRLAEKIAEHVSLPTCSMDGCQEKAPYKVERTGQPVCYGHGATISLGLRELP